MSSWVVTSQHLGNGGVPHPIFVSQFSTCLFPNIGVPQNGWFIMENPIKMDDLGMPLFLETPTPCCCGTSADLGCHPFQRRRSSCGAPWTFECQKWRSHGIAGRGWAGEQLVNSFTAQPRSSWDNLHQCVFFMFATDVYYLSFKNHDSINMLGFLLNSGDVYQYHPRTVSTCCFLYHYLAAPPSKKWSSWPLSKPIWWNFLNDNNAPWNPNTHTHTHEIDIF